MITGELCKRCGHADYTHEKSACAFGAKNKHGECSCKGFISPVASAIEALPQGEKELLACAQYLGLDPTLISRIVMDEDSGGHFTGLKVVVRISTGYQINSWVREHLPKWASESVKGYLLRRDIKTRRP